MEGMIVKSVSGHDSGSWYVILKTDGGFAYIADGKNRKVEKPKKKNIRHIRRTKKFVAKEEFESGLTNKKLKRILHEYNYGKNGNAEEAENIAEEVRPACQRKT